MPDGHIFHPSILRAYDIRGLAGDTLTEKDALALGRAFGTRIVRRGGKTVCLARDGRLSSPALAESLCEGLVSTGLTVEDLGVGPSPYLYFSIHDRETDGGIIVTGSHNPSTFNGFKMMDGTRALHGQDIAELAAIAKEGDFAKGDGQRIKIDWRKKYVERLVQNFPANFDLKIAWDAGNGAAGEVLSSLTRRLPGKHILLHEKVDGTFPAHHPDPTVDDNLKDLIRCVSDNGCNLGIAFDGDGDRLGIVDDRGQVLRCDQLMMFLAKDVLSRHPGAAIVADVKCSQALFDGIETMGGHAVMCRTGHSLVRKALWDHDAQLAGELSGHIFFRDGYYGFDDALYASLRFITFLSKNGKPLSVLKKSLPYTVNTPEIRIPIDDSEKFTVIDRLAATLADYKGEPITINRLDGVRVGVDGGWWLARASNTESAISLRAEAENIQTLEKIGRMVETMMAEIGVTCKIDTSKGVT
jgi:phosphomannomutase